MPPHSSQTIKVAPRRLTQLSEALPAQQLDAVILSAPHHLRAFCGIDVSAGVLLVRPSGVYLLLDPRYSTSAQLPPGIELVPYANSDQLVGAVQATLSRSARHIGVHAGTMTLSEWGRLLALEHTHQAVDPLIAELTSILENEEISRLQQAHAYTETALGAVRNRLVDGISERELQLVVINTLLDLGDGLAFDPMVTFGEKTAQPHATSGRVLLAQGQLVLADLGAKVGGLHADLTQTWLWGQNDRAQELIDLTHTALQAAIQAVYPGVSAAEIDEAGRQPIRAAGLDAYTLRGIGHALGYEVHQPPILREHGPQTLQANQVLALEPGVYLPGFGGVRLEEMVVVTPTGAVPISEWRSD